MSGHQTPTSDSGLDPIQAWLAGEYFRLIAIGTMACTGAVWLTRLNVDRSAPVVIIGAVAVISILTFRRIGVWARLALVAMLITGLVFAIGPQGDWRGPVPILSPIAILCALVVLGLADMTIGIRRLTGGLSNKAIAILVVAFLAAAYLIAVPAISSYLEQFEEKPSSFKVEELSTLEILRIRTTKLVIFGIFAYFGAAMGSFLNVVSKSAPKGEPIALRSSACPKCGSALRRSDNLPIIGFLMLGGRCRSCRSPIAFRYLAVELLAMSICSALFLYQLVRGAANIPEFQHYHYTGIVWMILYTKWPVIGIYFYHAVMFCCVMLFALMELDRARCPQRLSMGIILSFAALGVALPILQPVAFDSQIPINASSSMPTVVTALVTCVAGGSIGLVAAAISRNVSLSSPTFAALLLLGVSLGWQAMLAICVIWAACTLIIRQAQRIYPSLAFGPTTILLVAALIHHPAWKFIASRLSLS